MEAGQLSVLQAAVAAYGEEDAHDFMDHFHKGSLAEVVLGSKGEFVDPSTKDPEQQAKIIAYLNEIAAQRKPGVA